MKKSIILFSMILLTLFTLGCSNKEIYGNNDDEILKYLNQSDFLNSLGKENITIIDTIYVDDSKIVGFTTNTGQGVLAYKKDENRNYSMVDAKAEGTTVNSLGVTTYRIRYNYDDDLPGKAYIVISNGDIVSKVDVSINKYNYSEQMKIGEPSMVMIKEDLPYDEANEITINYRYFDINNNELLPE